MLNFTMHIGISKPRNKLCDCESIIFTSSYYFFELNYTILWRMWHGI